MGGVVQGKQWLAVAARKAVVALVELNGFVISSPLILIY